jgi:hypothetical protein
VQGDRREHKAGRSIGDAVADAIETLPVAKTRDLRRWLLDWEAWERWQTWVAKGWAVKRIEGKIYVFGPSSQPDDEPSDAEVAAAAEVNRVHARFDLRYVHTLPSHKPKPEVFRRGRRTFYPIAQYLISQLR